MSEVQARTLFDQGGQNTTIFSGLLALWWMERRMLRVKENRQVFSCTWTTVDSKW